MDQLLTREEQSRCQCFYGDISDTALVRDVVKEVQPTHVIHLAGMQVPLCRADPVRGAQVNVVGTVNVFEAVRRLSTVQKVVCASSAAVCGSQDDYPSGVVGDDDHHKPATLYGVYKLANEGTARLYWQDYGIRSVCLRPHTVYGVGRELVPVGRGTMWDGLG